LFVEDIKELVIMLKIVELLLKRFQSFNNTSQNLLMIKNMAAHNMSSLHFKVQNQMHYGSPHILKVIMKMIGS